LVGSCEWSCAKNRSDEYLWFFGRWIFGRVLGFFAGAGYVFQDGASGWSVGIDVSVELFAYGIMRYIVFCKNDQLKRI
jgi:hypothetical protein